MPICDVIPDTWDTEERKDDVLDLVSALPLEPEDRKALLLCWSAETGIPLHWADYERALAHTPGESASPPPPPET